MNVPRTVYQVVFATASRALCVVLLTSDNAICLFPLFVVATLNEC